MLDGNMSDGKKYIKNELIFHPVKVLQNVIFSQVLKFVT